MSIQRIRNDQFAADAGIAGYDSWGDRPLPEHTLPANKEYHWGFTLMPVK